MLKVTADILGFFYTISKFPPLNDTIKNKIKNKLKFMFPMLIICMYYLKVIKNSSLNLVFLYYNT